MKGNRVAHGVGYLPNGGTSQMEIIDRKTNTYGSKGQENSSEVGEEQAGDGWVRGCDLLAKLCCPAGVKAGLCPARNRSIGTKHDASMCLSHLSRSREPIIRVNHPHGFLLF